eukprot:TRINITY_DN966_c0_g1_i1.p1 TRINITY_DN966_c0_g1~~TRINITY_DN966_c0_g1_i1.p1  ORF type:complete len:817 (+),score=44.79 TRINITY_DN966_c0_g1_i1:3330-5780(+)
MKPLVFSEADNDVAWTNKTDRIQIIKNASVPSSSGERTIPIDTIEENECTFPVRTGNGYTLSFAHTFKYDNDKVYFAFWKPYSYTRLQKFFQKCETDLIKEGIHKPFPWKKKHSSCWINAEAEIETRDISYKREQLCLSLGGVPVDLLTITASSQQSEDAPYLSYRNRSYVVITARVHAGETAGSYKAEGIIRFLLGKDPIAVALRQEHIFLIVPMLNPDGVVLGNNRCSLGGCDLNRCWGSPKRDLQPTIFQLKALLGELFASRKQISVYCDLHGHSQMLNSFIFACHTVSSSSVTSWTKVRLLPRIFSRKCHILKYSQCRFKVEPDKVSIFILTPQLNTARVIIWKEFGVINSFTLESSQYAYNIGEEVVRFTEKDYLKVATGFMEALHEYGRLLDQLQTEMKEYRKTHEPMFETTIERAETKPRRNEKLKIRVQMTRIPAFHKAQTRTFDSAESNNTENESNSSKNAASPSSVEQAAENNEYQCETPFKPSWKDYFTPQELEEITDELNFKEKQFVEDLSEPEEEDELELGPFLGNGKYVEDKKEEVVEKSPVQKKNNRTNFEYKDLIHVGYVKKSREMWDSWSSRIVHISPNKVQKKLPERPALEPKRNFSRDRALPRPGTTSATLGERSRKQRFEVDSRKMIPISHGKGYNEGMLLPCWETMQPYLTACEQPRGLIARFPPQPSPIRVRASKPVRGTSNNNAMRVCLVPAEGEKGMARIFQMQRQQSVRRHRPSIDAIPRKSKPVMKNPFTNSKIREHMGSRREYNQSSLSLHILLPLLLYFFSYYTRYILCLVYIVINNYMMVINTIKIN